MKVFVGAGVKLKDKYLSRILKENSINETEIISEIHFLSQAEDFGVPLKAIAEALVLNKVDNDEVDVWLDPDVISKYTDLGIMESGGYEPNWQINLNNGEVVQ